MSRQFDTFIHDQLLQEALWWSYERSSGEEDVVCSPEFEKVLGRAPTNLEAMMGSSASPIIKFKIDEVLTRWDQNRSVNDVRFVAFYETPSGERAYQHQLSVSERQGRARIFVICVDVTEMVKLEKKMVDAQGRSTLNQLIEREKFLKKQNEVIKEAYAKQSRFLGWISHELRSPLLGISSLVKRLKKTMTPSSEALTMLTAINMTAEQSTFLVNDILTFSQTEYDSIKLRPTQLSLSELLESVKQLTKSIANDKDLNLSMVQLTEHDTVTVDSVRLTQVLINLIVNGIKFTQYGGVNLEIKEVESGHFRFTVSDSGEGITESNLMHIFEPFAQIETQESGAFKQRSMGAGLGLFVVKQLIELMGGGIEVSSTQNVGTQFVFTLELPYEKRELRDTKSTGLIQAEKVSPKIALEVTDTKLSKTYSGGDKPRVLIADDSEINRMVLVGYLDELDCKVVEAKDGLIAWNILQEESFDYVLLDIQMPNMDGIEVAEKLNTLCETGLQADLKGVIAITAGGEQEGFVDGRDGSGLKRFDEWVVKPVTQSQILKMLSTDYRHSGAAAEEKKHKETVIRSEKGTEKGDGEGENNHTPYLPTVDLIPNQFHNLIPAYITEMKQCIQQVRALNEVGDSDEVKKVAHYIKGNAMLFQLQGVVDLCKQIEQLHTDPDALKDNMQKITLDCLEKLEIATKNLEKSLSIGHNIKLQS